MTTRRTTIFAIGIACAMAAGCDHSRRSATPTTGWGTPTAPPPGAAAQDPRVAIYANECADFIGTINAGIELVGHASSSDGDSAGDDDDAPDGPDGKSDLASTAEALNSVAREIDSKHYTHPDLERLRGVYVVVTNGLADTTRDTEAALDALTTAQENQAKAKKGDKAAADAVAAAEADVKAVADKAETVTNQEDATVDAINQVCAPYSNGDDDDDDDGTPNGPPPGAPPPGAPPPGAPLTGAPPPGAGGLPPGGPPPPMQ